jgi:hypothetical protein
MPFAVMPVVNGGFRVRRTGREVALIIVKHFFGAAQALVLAEDSQDRRVQDKLLQARRSVHGKIDLFDEDELVVVVPMVQNGIERSRGHVLGHQEELAMGDDVCPAVVRQFERIAKILQGFGLISKDEKEVRAMFDVPANLVNPAFYVGIHQLQSSLS